MSEEVKTTEETLYCECCGCLIDATITATPDAAVVMRYYMRTMLTIWTVKHTAVTATRTSERKAT